MYFSFHLLETSPWTAVRLLLRRWSRTQPAGLLRSEPMAAMELATPIVSTRRFRPGRVALFAVWESFDDLDAWLAEDAVGRRWAQGWHVRLEFLRRWGHVAALDGLPAQARHHDLSEPVVAVTLARLKLPQIPRFIRWGRPVEAQVRDDPGQVLALAAGAPPRTVSTFTVWRSAQAMTDMVAGRSHTPGARRHVEAMEERRRSDFHREFTTLRFPLPGGTRVMARPHRHRPHATRPASLTHSGMPGVLHPRGVAVIRSPSCSWRPCVEGAWATQIARSARP